MSYCFFTEEGFKKIKGEVAELERYIKIDIAKALATGESTGDAAKRFHVSPSRISQKRRLLQQSWRAFQGEHVEDSRDALVPA